MSCVEINVGVKFSIGDKVFAKIKGYPYWPAVITGIDNNSKKLQKYNVTFFGAQDTGLVSQDNICAYNENKNVYGVQRVNNFKNKAQFGPGGAHLDNA